MSRLGEARAAKVKRSASVPWGAMPAGYCLRSEEHTSELQSRSDLVCRLLLEKKKKDSQFLPTEEDATPGLSHHATAPSASDHVHSASAHYRVRAAHEYRHHTIRYVSRIRWLS